MCGICGIVGPDANQKSLVQNMTKRLSHRGPDGEGVFQDEGCSLGHARLAIIDVKGGHQPITDREGTRTIVYNGEVYNHATLRNQLQAKGYEFKTKSDGEVPLHLLEETGDVDAALDQLDGMFSFVVWNNETKRLVAARDPYGIKPFFYTRLGDNFLFASEMKSLLAHPDVNVEFDQDAIKEKAIFEYLTPGRTYFKGIRELPPGHYLETDGKSIRTTRYHDNDVIQPETDPEALGHQLYNLLLASVKKRLMSERPLGVILSGGLDSSLITALNRDLDSERDITTFTVAENEENVDFQNARHVAQALGTHHHERLFDRDEYEKNLADMVWANEDIDHETYFNYAVFSGMKPTATVGLCGQGADEVFGGYERYRDMDALRNTIRSRTAAAYPDATDRHDEILQSHYGELSTLLEWERGPQLSHFQLRLVDRNSMAFGTEIRVPFLDKAVVALGRGLKENELIHQGIEKVALRKAAALSSLPKSIVDRPKLPAGRTTSQGIVQAFEADIEKHYPENRAVRWPAHDAFRTKAWLLTLDILEEIFVNRRGERPKNLAWNDFL